MNQARVVGIVENYKVFDSGAYSMDLCGVQGDEIKQIPVRGFVSELYGHPQGELSVATVYGTIADSVGGQYVKAKSCAVLDCGYQYVRSSSGRIALDMLESKAWVAGRVCSGSAELTNGDAEVQLYTVKAGKVFVGVSSTHQSNFVQAGEHVVVEGRLYRSFSEKGFKLRIAAAVTYKNGGQREAVQ